MRYYSSMYLIGSQGYEVHAIDMTAGEQMQQLGCKTYQCDLRSEKSIESFAENFKDKRLDLLLNIAGISTRSPYFTVGPQAHGR